VEVGAAETDRRDTHAYVVAARRDNRNVAKLNPAHVNEYSGEHRNRLRATGYGLLARQALSWGRASALQRPDRPAGCSP
jgi:hypothetical protein